MSLTGRREQLLATMMRIGGAIQVLEELLFNSRGHRCGVRRSPGTSRAGGRWPGCRPARALSVQVPGRTLGDADRRLLGAGLTSLPMGPVELDDLDPGAVWIIRTPDVVAHVALDEVCDDAAAQVGMVIADSIAKAVAW